MEKLSNYMPLLLRYSSLRNLHVSPDFFSFETLLKYVQAHCDSLGIFVCGCIRYATDNARSVVHIWMLIPVAIYPLPIPASLPFFFFFPFSLIWSRAAVIGNNPGEPRWKFVRRPRVECIRILLVTYITVTLLCQQNNGSVEEERRDKRYRFRENAPAGILSSVICMSSSFILTILFVSKSCMLSLSKNVIRHVQSPWKLRLFKR